MAQQHLHRTPRWVPRGLAGQVQVLREATPWEERPQYLICDNAAKHGRHFARGAKATGVALVKIPYRVPRANAIGERFLGAVRRECLDHLMIFGERQLYRVIQEYVAYFNRARPQQGLEQSIPEGSRIEEARSGTGTSIAFPVLGGLHHDYRRAA